MTNRRYSQQWCGLEDAILQLPIVYKSKVCCGNVGCWGNGWQLRRVAGEACNVTENALSILVIFSVQLQQTEISEIKLFIFHHGFCWALRFGTFMFQPLWNLSSRNRVTPVSILDGVSVGSLSRIYCQSLWCYWRFLRRYRRSLLHYHQSLRRRNPWGDWRPRSRWC